MIHYKIVDVSLFENEIKQLFKKHPFGRYLSDRHIDREGSISYEWNMLLSYSKKGNIAIAINDNNHVVGLIGFHLSEWDSEVFNKRFAFLHYFLVEETNPHDERIISENLLVKLHAWVKDNEIQVVVTKLDTQYFSPVYVLQQHGYILFETVTLQTIDAKNVNKKIADGIKFRHANEFDTESLQKIALKNTFTKSHFYLDTDFDVDKVEMMYAKWIENALRSEQRIVIVEENEKIAGVFIYAIVDHTETLNKKFGVWKSAFVDSSFRNKGVGLKLFKATLQSCINDGVDVVDSSLVEKNIISQSFHNKLGFRLVNSLYTLHKWFD